MKAAGEKALKKVNFRTYLIALNWGAPNSRTHYAETTSAVITFFTLIFCINWLGGEAGIPLTLTFAVFFIPAIISLVYCVRRTPTLFKQLPISPVRKTVFFFLSAVLLTFITALLVVLACLFVMLVLALLILAATGEWIFVAEQSSETVSALCPQGELLGWIMTVGIVGMGLLFASVEKNYLRHVLTILTPIFVTLPLLLLMRFGGVAMGQLFFAFDSIPYSFVYLIVFALIALVLLAVGAIRIIKILKPRDY